MHSTASPASSRIPTDVFRAARRTAAIVTGEIMLGSLLIGGWNQQSSYNDRAQAGLVKAALYKTAPAVPAPSAAPTLPSPRMASAAAPTEPSPPITSPVIAPATPVGASVTVVVSPAPVTTVATSSPRSPASHASRTVVAQAAPAPRAPEVSATPEALTRQIRSAQREVCACGFRDGEAAGLVFADDGRLSRVMGASGARGDCARAALASRVRTMPSRNGPVIPFVFRCLSH